MKKLVVLLAVAAIVAAIPAAHGMRGMEKYFRDVGPTPRWYIPPEEGPLVGAQKFWYVTPHDLLPGGYAINSGKKGVANVTEESLEVTPLSVWGRYTYRVTPRTATGGETEFPDRSVVGSELIQWGDLPQVADPDRTLLIRGEVEEVYPQGKGFRGTIRFKDGPLPVRFDVIKVENEKRLPDVHSRHYGPHWEHTFDIYYPGDFKRGSDAPLPMLLYIHGGGWNALDKSGVNRSADSWNEAGIAVGSLNYRYVSMYDEHPAMTVPVAAPLLDAVRGLQYIKHHADELGIDPDRICLTGGSAGGASSAWLAMHADMAQPDSDDPVARMSTRVACSTPHQAQTSLDPRRMRQWIPSVTYGAHAFFPSDVLPKKGEKRFQYFLDHRREILPYVEDFSAYRQASADDPPMLLVYGGQKDVLPAEDSGHATHHPKFGEMLCRRLRELGVECYYWADNVRCHEKRYDRWHGVHIFVKDKLLGSGWDAESE